MANILVIEDDDQVRDLTRRILQDAGHSVRVAVDGKAGLEAFLEAAPDLVITDLIMPSMGGLETMRRIFEAAPETKIVAISGAGRGGLTQASELGAAGIIEKPYSSTELVSLVVQVLKQSGIEARRV